MTEATASEGVVPAAPTDAAAPVDPERRARFREWCAAQPVSAGTRGVETLVEGVVAALPRKTWIYTGRRERGAAILRGADPERIAEARPYKVVPPGSSPAQRALFAVGTALAGEPACAFLGTGSVSYGAFHEALHLAAATQASVLFVVSWYVGEGPFGEQLAVDPASLASAVGLRVATVDGTDSAAVRAAVERLGSGPALLQAELRGRS